MALAGAVFCISGALSKTRAAIEKEIKDNGGETSGSVTAKVTHLLCAPSEFEGKTAKVLTALAKGTSIVKEDFLWAAIKVGKLPSTRSYTLGGKSKADEPPSRAPPSKKARTSGPKGAPAVDKACPLSDVQVYCEDDVYFDVEMVQQDIPANMDKYYDMQLLEDDDGEYHVLYHWGRAGTSGSTKCDKMPDLDKAKKEFGSTFRSKSGYAWGSSSYSPAKMGKYTVIDRLKGMDTTKYKWEYYVDKPVDGKRPGWYPYDDEVMANMERYYAQFCANAWLKIRYVHSGKFTYKVDFAASHQTNVDLATHTQRKIRRASR